MRVCEMDVRRLKEGPVLRYKQGFLQRKWKEYHCILFSDSMFCWYDKKGDSRPVGKILLKDYIPYICMGFMCDRMPVRRPKLLSGYSVHHLVGIGRDPQASDVSWFLFSSDVDLGSWFNEITKTLPKPSNPSPTQPQFQPTSNPITTSGVPRYNPPAVYPSAPLPASQHSFPYPQSNPGYQPPPVYDSSRPNYPGNFGQGSGGFGGYSGGGGAPQATVIIQDRGRNASGSSGPGFGTGLGTGMLMGSLMGYGLGSCWGGGIYPSFGGHGSGYGLGGGYVQDNDTYITNNYYGGGGPSNDGAQVQDTSNADAGTVEVNQSGSWDTNSEVNSNTNDMHQYDGADYNGDAGYGGGDVDYGGGDFGGGDFGGGDFGDDF